MTKARFIIARVKSNHRVLGFSPDERRPFYQGYTAVLAPINDAAPHCEIKISSYGGFAGIDIIGDSPAMQLVGKVVEIDMKVVEPEAQP